MTRKERILRLIERLPQDIGFKHMIYHLTVLKGVEIGVERTLAGAGIDDDGFFQRLLDEDPFWPPLPGADPHQETAAKPGSLSRSASSKPNRSKSAASKRRQA